MRQMCMNQARAHRGSVLQENMVLGEATAHLPGAMWKTDEAQNWDGESGLWMEVVRRNARQCSKFRKTTARRLLCRPLASNLLQVGEYMHIMGLSSLRQCGKLRHYSSKTPTSRHTMTCCLRKEAPMRNPQIHCLQFSTWLDSSIKNVLLSPNSRLRWLLEWNNPPLGQIPVPSLPKTTLRVRCHATQQKICFLAMESKKHDKSF